MSNLYHLLHRAPRTQALDKVSEALARRLVASGKLRINADTQRNFVRLGGTGRDVTFTARELTDPALRGATRARLARHVAPAEGVDGIAALEARLLRDLKKARGVEEDRELRLARLLVQAAHPAVMQRLLAEGTEVFVSFSHNVGDLMPVHAWHTHGTASGLQATEAGDTAVYVSAGGDPFFTGKDSDKYYATDGFPAMARLMVIAGQELGHFADLLRVRGQVVGRHSTAPHAPVLTASPLAAQARRQDQAQVAALAALYARAGRAGLKRAEERCSFYHTRRRFSLPWAWWWTQRLVRMLWLRGCLLAWRIPPPPQTIPPHPLATRMGLYLSDMAFNLAPQADAYRHPNPVVEEAIAVIESVARVPQQVMKWGHPATARAYPALYHFYYGRVIPALSS